LQVRNILNLFHPHHFENLAFPWIALFSDKTSRYLTKFSVCPLPLIAGFLLVWHFRNYPVIYWIPSVISLILIVLNGILLMKNIDLLIGKLKVKIEMRARYP